MIVDRVSSTPLPDHGVLVPVAGGSGAQRVGSHCRAADVAPRGRGIAAAGGPTTDLVTGSSVALRVGPAVAVPAADAPAGHAGHVAGLAPSLGDPQVAVPEPARPPVGEQSDPRTNRQARPREPSVGVSPSTWRTRSPWLPAQRVDRAAHPARPGKWPGATGCRHLLADLPA